MSPVQHQAITLTCTDSWILVIKLKCNFSQNKQISFQENG